MQTLTELYQKNTMEFGFEIEGITLVESHKVSYNLIQTLGKIVTRMQISQDGNIQANELLETLMGIPSDNIRQEVRKGLGRNYNQTKVLADIKASLENDGVIESKKEINAAANDLYLMLESSMITALFELYLEKSNIGEETDTPR